MGNWGNIWEIILKKEKKKKTLILLFNSKWKEHKKNLTIMHLAYSSSGRVLMEARLRNMTRLKAIKWCASNTRTALRFTVVLFKWAETPKQIIIFFQDSVFLYSPVLELAAQTRLALHSKISLPLLPAYTSKCTRIEDVLYHCQASSYL